MRTPNKEKVKEVLLQLLDEFISVCKKYNLRYCAAYGTLLGAVREGGIIDHDYDADVFMPFEDYNKLYELNKKEKIFGDEFYLDTYDLNNPFSLNYQLKKKGTTAIKEAAYNGCNMFMDIYPIFDVPNNDETKNLLLFLGRMFVDSRLLYRHTRQFSCGRQQIIDLDKSLNSINTLTTDRDNIISVDYHTFLHWKYTSGDLNEDRLNKYIDPYINFNNLYESTIKGLSSSIFVPSKYEEILEHHYGDWKIPVEYTNKQFDWFLDGERDWTAYATVGLNNK